MAKFPIPSYHFSVSFFGDTTINFQEVSGFGIEIETEEINDGIYNNTVRRALKRKKYSPVVLKNGIVSDSNKIISLLKEKFGKSSEQIKEIVPTIGTVQIMLKDDTNSTILTWTLDDAIIVKYNFGKFNAQENNLAIVEVEVIFDKYTVS